MKITPFALTRYEGDAENNQVPFAFTSFVDTSLISKRSPPIINRLMISSILILNKSSFSIKYLKESQVVLTNVIKEQGHLMPATRRTQLAIRLSSNGFLLEGISRVSLISSIISMVFISVIFKSSRLVEVMNNFYKGQ